MRYCNISLEMLSAQVWRAATFSAIWCAFGLDKVSAEPAGPRCIAVHWGRRGGNQPTASAGFHKHLTLMKPKNTGWDDRVKKMSVRVYVTESVFVGGCVFVCVSETQACM